MRKFLLTLLIAAGTMSSFRSAAQTPNYPFEIYFFNFGATNFSITQFTYSVTSSQKPSIFGSPYTYTASGTTAQPMDVIDYGGWWTTLSTATPLTITVNSGLTATVHNTSPQPQMLRMNVEFAGQNGSLPTLIHGTYVTIPGNGTSTLPVPTGSAQYQSGPPTLYSSDPYPVPVAFYISD